MFILSFNIDITRYKSTIFPTLQYSHTFLYFEHTNRHAACMGPLCFYEPFSSKFWILRDVKRANFGLGVVCAVSCHTKHHSFPLEFTVNLNFPRQQ